MAGWVTPVDFIEFDSNPAATTVARPNLGMSATRPYLKALGQTVNVVTGNVANEPLGTLAVPAIVINVIGTITLTNSLITATTSMIFLSVKRVGTDASTARGPVVWVDAIAAGSATIGVKAQGVAIAVSTYVVHYWIIN